MLHFRQNKQITVIIDTLRYCVNFGRFWKTCKLAFEKLNSYLALLFDFCSIAHFSDDSDASNDWVIVIKFKINITPLSVIFL